MSWLRHTWIKLSHGVVPFLFIDLWKCRCGIKWNRSLEQVRKRFTQPQKGRRWVLIPLLPCRKTD